MRMIGAPSPEQVEAIAEVLKGRITQPGDAYIVAAHVLDALGAPTEDTKSPDLDAIIARADKLLDDLALTHEQVGPLGMVALRVGMRAVLDELTP